MTSIAEEHMGFADELNDAKLLNLAVERMKKAGFHSVRSSRAPQQRTWHHAG